LFMPPNYLESTALSKVAEPPADLNKRKLPIIEKAGPLFRISSVARGAGGVIYFGANKTERFDDPDGKFGVCYLGEDEHAAFIEVFGQAKKLLVDLAFVHDRAISEIKPMRKLRLVDITGPGAAWIGAAGEVSAGDHAISQNWSRALFSHPNHVDGIYFRCRHDLSRMSIALFDREPDLLQLVSYNQWSGRGMDVLLGKLLDHYKFGIKT
jgi:hypothetical protein